MGVQAAVARPRADSTTAVRALRAALFAGALLGANACQRDEPVPAARPPTPHNPSPQSSPVDAGAALPPLAPVAGIAGFRCVSQVRFAAAPDQPHQLEIVQLFPARHYACLSHQGPGGLARAIELLAGERAWRIEPDAVQAQRLGDRARSELELRAALRAALVLWPEGHAWRADAAAPGRYFAEISDSTGPCGRLVVVCAAGAAPTSAHAEVRDGTTLEELRALAWESHEGRAWPASSELWVDGEHVWTETLSSASSRVSFQDEFFLPRLAVAPEPQALSPGEDGH
jgi:hypothetical protein